MNKFKKLIPWGISLMPFLVVAAQDIERSFLDPIGEILSTVIPVLMILATVLFLWGVIKFITAGGDEEKRKEAKNFIVYGLIGLFVMVAVWGIVQVLESTFETERGEIPLGPGNI